MPAGDTALASSDAVVVWAAVIQATGAVVAALIAVAILYLGYRHQKSLARREERSRNYAESIQALHDYLEAPYRVRRRDGSEEARMRVTSEISDVQSRLRYYEALLSLDDEPEVETAYRSAVAAARREAGTAMTEAWGEDPTKKDRDVPLKLQHQHPETTDAINQLLAAMKAARGH